MNTKLTESK